MTPGAEIRAELVVDEKSDYWLENIGIIAAPNPNQPAPPVDERFAQIGKEIPDFKLTNQDGKRFSLKDYRGKALAITFIYAQCPLPDYCIRMSTNFSDLANQVRETDLKDKIRLLSISFDPERDTPEKLKQYGTGYLGKDAKPDFTVWQLAVGSDKEVREVADFFGLRYEARPERQNAVQPLAQHGGRRARRQSHENLRRKRMDAERFAARDGSDFEMSFSDSRLFTGRNQARAAREVI